MTEHCCTASGSTGESYCYSFALEKRYMTAKERPMNGTNQERMGETLRASQKRTRPTETIRPVCENRRDATRKARSAQWLESPVNFQSAVKHFVDDGRGSA